MGKVIKTIFKVVAVAALIYFAPQVALALGASGFLAVAIGAVVILAGTALINGITRLLSGNGKKGADSDAGKVTLRVGEAPRWLAAGITRQGGAVVFADYDTAGNLWFIVIHSDTILTGINQILFDDIVISVNGSGEVITDDFCLNDKKEPYKGSGTRVPYFQIWTVTHSATNPVPPAVAALLAALPAKWTSDHKLAGTSYSVIKCKAVANEDRYKVFKWRGPLGLGEPAVSVVGQFAKCYDPRDVTQTLGQPSTYKFTRNPVLIWAWFRTHPYGRRKPISAINWVKVGEQATICDQNVTGLNGVVKRYQCGISIPDNKERATAEQEIITTCDGQLVFDDDGKCWLRAGYYYTPTLALSRNRDIAAMESVEATNGESETQGVVVRYTEPLANYSPQPSAPWYNPNYYVEGQGVDFLTVDVLACQDHNQAMRLAKSIGLRSQPIHKLAPITGLRGLKARQERIINLNYDNTFSGDYEIATPVEVDESGQFCSFGAVPVDADQWTLLVGEEKARPVIDDTNLTLDPAPPTVSGFDFRNNRFEFNFLAAGRDDLYFDFQYAAQPTVGEPVWSDATTSMVQNYAYSGTVETNKTYLVRWRGRNAGGVVTDWEPEETITVPDLVGLNSAQVLIYKRSATVPALPTATATYTFATGAITGLDNGWTRAIPAANGQPLYVSAASASSSLATDTIAPGEWAGAVILVNDGATGTPGLNVATVYLFQRTATNVAPALPTDTLTYTFATGVLSGGSLNSWAQSMPTTGGAYRWITTATSSNTTGTDSLPGSEWAAASLLAENGTNGFSSGQAKIYKRSATVPALPTATATYTFATGVITGLDNGWTQAIPASDGNPLYTSVAIASGQAATDTIGAGEWASPVIEAQDGSTPPKQAAVFIYQRTATNVAPTLPSAAATFTFATGGITGLDNGWTADLPAAGGSYRWRASAAALSIGTTDSIAAGEWASPQLIAQDGASGTPGANAFIVTPSQPAIVLTADPAGVIDPAAQLPFNITFKAKLGATDVTALTTWSGSTSVDCGVTNNGNGSYTLDSAGARNGSFTITATYSGNSNTITIPYNKSIAGPATNRVVDTSLTNTASASFVPVSDTLTIAFPPNTVMTFSASDGYSPVSGSANNATARKKFRFMYRNVTDGGAWTQAGSDIVGTYAIATYIVFPTEPEFQSGAIGGSYNGLVAPGSTKVYEVRLDALKDGGATLDASSGNFQVSIS